MLSSPAAAAKLHPRERGTPRSQRMLLEQQACASASRLLRRSRSLPLRSSSGAPGEIFKPNGARDLGRGRAAMNMPLKLGGSVQNLEDRKQSLMEKAEFRPTHKVSECATQYT